MSGYPLLTRNDRAERARRIAKRYEAGEHAQALADEFGLSRTRVNEICLLYGVSRPQGRRPGSKVAK